MLGAIAVTQTPLTPNGQVEIRGEIWQASLRNHATLPAGASVLVCSIDGLTLIVEPAGDSTPS
jgi:membrane-bound serine protease (ClpP class)